MLDLPTLALNTYYAFRPRKPRLLARLVWTVFRSFILRRPPLRYVDFAIDFACNLRCEHCFATALHQPGARVMTSADYARIARECMAMGTVNFSFQGGEPLLCEKLPDILRACQPDRNLISVTTNGTLLSNECVADLARWGVDILTVSVDSGIPEEHDHFRGRPGAFDQTMAGIERALARGLRVTLGTVVTHQTLRKPGIKRLLALARSKRLLLYLIFPVPAGRWTDNNEMFLTTDDLVFIERLTRESPFIRTDFQANLGGHGCGAAKEILYMTPYGDVLACPFLHISLGNVLNESVSTIRARALRNPWFSSYHSACLASTDKEFIQRHLSRTFHAPALPIPWKDAFPDSPP